MTNYQLNRLDTILKENGIRMICACLAGKDSGFIYQIETLSSENTAHVWFSRNTELTEDKYSSGSIWSARVPSGKLTELVAFLQIPESNPAR